MASSQRTSDDKQRSAAAKRMAEYRKRMRAKGLKPVHIWLPDRNNPAYIEECKRQAAALAANDPGGDEIMAEIEDGGYDLPPYVWPEGR